MDYEIAAFEDADVDEVFALWSASEGIGLFGETPQRVRDCLARIAASNPRLAPAP